jgi:hypothetical protein
MEFIIEILDREFENPNAFADDTKFVTPLPSLEKVEAEDIDDAVKLARYLAPGKDVVIYKRETVVVV